MPDNVTEDNEFRLSQVSELHVGRVIRVKQIVGKNEEAKRLVCDVEIDDGGRAENVPYYGGGVDSTTKNPHGLFVPPRVDQMVVIGFIKALWSNPVCCFPVPHPSWNVNNAGLKDYDNIMESLDDISLFHFSGSKLHLRADGSFELAKKINGTDYKIKIEISEVKKTKTVTDVDNGNKVTMSEDGALVEDKNANKVLMDASGIAIQDKNGNSVYLDANGVKVVDKNGGELIMDAAGMKLKTGDASAWKPCTIPLCLFSGAPHGGAAAGIVKLTGG